MNRLYIFLLFLIAFSLNLLADKKDEHRKEKMFREVQEFKMKYLAQEMGLNEDQKKMFFELYGEMSKSKEECYKESRLLEIKLKKDKDASEEDYQHLTEAKNKANLENAEIEKNYDEKFAEFLSPKQIYEMKEAEKNFRNKLEDMRREKRKEHKMKEQK